MDWIIVKEKLPISFNPVFVSYFNENIIGDIVNTIDVGYYRKDNATWYFADSVCKIDGQVCMWMN